MKTIIVIVALLLTGISFAGERRYVVSTKTMDIVFNEYALWTDAGWADSCSRAVIGGTKADQQRFCTDGFSGLKPKIGSVVVGTEVELLDSKECKQMVFVRVLTGSLRGATGCMSATGLSSLAPQNDGGNTITNKPQEPASPAPKVQTAITSGTPFRWEDTDRVKNGMTEAEVLVILGKPYSRSESGEHATLVWSYTSNIDGSKAVAYSFRNGRVIGNSMVGR